MKLSVSLIPAELTSPILDGEVEPDGVEVVPTRVDGVDGNSRRMQNLEFDVAEMSLATFSRARAHGVPLIGLPIFTGRRFVQPGIGCRPGSGIADARELRGRRVGVNQYWMTSSVWHRAVLYHEYGITEDQLEWVTLGPERFGDGTFPNGARVERRDGATMEALLDAGEIDAVLFSRPVAQRFDAALAVSPFDDIVATQRDYYGRTGLFPIMHFIVMRADLYRDEPGLGGRIFEAFARAKEAVLADPARRTRIDPPVAGQDVDAALDLFGGDPCPYGLAANRKVLEWFETDIHRQGLVPAPLAVEDIFAPLGD